MGHEIHIFLIVVFAASLIAVPISTRMGLGSVIGLLVAGLVIGPEGLKLASNLEDISHLAEFGVVLLLFLIGLELDPRSLWKMRSSIFGLGSLQLVMTTLFFYILLLALKIPSSSAIIAGLGLSMSSTAIVMQLLSERGLRNSLVGQNCFGVLLFQDLSVIPILILVSFLGTAEGPQHVAVSPLSAFLVIIGIIVFGRYLSRPVFRWIAGTGNREVTLALALLIVVGIGYLMTSVGLSMALGAFLGGVVLAESEYRHELVANIEPFKGLLLGLFFLSVGMGIKVSAILESPLMVGSLVLAIILIKSVVLLTIGHRFNLKSRDRVLFALLLSQGGEFAFVMFANAQTGLVFSPEFAAILNGSVALSMVTTPILLAVFDRWSEKCAIEENAPKSDVIDKEGHQVIVAGFGRVGQIVVRLLHLNRFSTTVIDHSPDHIERVRRFGNKAYYGDASQIGILEAAGIQDAKLFIITVDDRDKVLEMVDTAKRYFPHVPILARAFDRTHAYELIKRGVSYFERETFGSALNMGELALQILGVHPFKAHRTALHFKRHDLDLIQRLYQVHTDEKEIISTSRAAKEHLEKLFVEDALASSEYSSRGWD